MLVYGTQPRRGRTRQVAYLAAGLALTVGMVVALVAQSRGLVLLGAAVAGLGWAMAVALAREGCREGMLVRDEPPADLFR